MKMNRKPSYMNNGRGNGMRTSMQENFNAQGANVSVQHVEQEQKIQNPPPVPEVPHPTSQFHRPNQPNQFNFPNGMPTLNNQPSMVPASFGNPDLALDSKNVSGKGWGLFDLSDSAEANPFRTALLTSSLTILGAVIGELALGKTIKAMPSKWAGAGMGALIGGITANAIRLAIASQMSEGGKAAAASFAGGIIPVTIPIALTLLNKTNTRSLAENKTQIALALGGLGLMTAVPLVFKLKK